MPTETFPTLYGGWLRELLGGPLPEETRATCSDCAMLPREGETPCDTKTFFNPHTKCCTYLPDLPNYLVGRILGDGSPEMAAGRASVERRMEKRIEVTPLGIGQPSSYLLWYHHSSAGFGRSQTLLCPHYIDQDGGLCSIWRHREATCATWFCKHDRGAAGQRFWRDGIHRLLNAVEGALSCWCLLELDLGTAAIERVLELSENYETIDEGELESNPEPAAYAARWGRWAGREAEFYQSCAKLVGALGWKDVVRISGPRIRLLAQLSQDLYAKLDPAAPQPALRCGSFRLVSLRNDVAHLSTYSDYDPVEVPARLMGVLQHFQGQPTSEAVATIAEREKVTLNPELVRKMADFELLVPATPSGGAASPRPSFPPGHRGSGRK